METAKPMPAIVMSVSATVLRRRPVENDHTEHRECPDEQRSRLPIGCAGWEDIGIGLCEARQHEHHDCAEHRCDAHAGDDLVLPLLRQDEENRGEDQQNDEAGAREQAPDLALELVGPAEDDLQRERLCGVPGRQRQGVDGSGRVNRGIDVVLVLEIRDGEREQESAR